MNINKNIIEEINRFKMMSGYQPGKLLSEQKILNEKTTFYGKTYVYYNDKPNAIDGVNIGYIDDETKIFYPNKNGAKLFDLKKDSPYKIGGNDTYFNGIWNFHTKEKTFVLDVELDDNISKIQDRNQEVEQMISDVEGADWKNGDSGSLIFISDKTPAASRIKGPGVFSFNNTKSWNLLYAFTKSHVGTYDRPGKGTPPSMSSVTIEDKFIINGARKTFCDNVVDVDLTNQDNLSEFNNIVDKIEKYITAPNDDQGKTSLSKFKMTIMGQADSAAPGWLPGPPCNKTSTEIGHNYGGIEKKPRSERSSTDLHQMNMYLATMRARNYKNLIIDEIKKRTGLTIQIEELPAKEYYGEGESKRGSQWRSMVLTPTAPLHSFSETIPIDGDKGTDPVISDYNKIKEAGYEKAKIKLKSNDSSNTFRDFNSILKGDTVYVEATSENLGYLSKYGPNEYSISKASAKINGDKFEFIITTNDGNTYKFEPKVGANRGEASNVIASNALLGQFNCKAQGVGSGIGINDEGKEVDLEFASFVTDIDGKPANDSLDMYDESDQVTINNKTYYKIVSLGFQLVGTNCQAYKVIQWPTEEEVKSLKKFQQPKEFSDKDLEKMKKAIETGKNKKIEKTKRQFNTGGLEDIQQDIQLR